VGKGAAHAPRLAYLATWPPPPPGDSNPFFEGLQELGYTAGENIVIDARYAAGHLDQLSQLAAELIALKPDIIVADGEQAAIVAKNATNSIPIVFTAVSDPVAIGVVASLARPGGNATGFSDDQARTVSKHVDLAAELVPGLTALGVLWSPEYVTMVVKLKGVQAAAQALGIGVQPIEIRRREDFDEAFRTAANAHLPVLIVTGSILTNQAGQQLGELAIEYKLLTIGSGDYAIIGYGPNIPALRRRAATAVARILNGANPADLAVQKANTFDLTINLHLANAIGVTIPPALISEATAVVQ
jgi:putative ABC transport system substrate-binding protein